MLSGRSQRTCDVDHSTSQTPIFCSNYSDMGVLVYEELIIFYSYKWSVWTQFTTRESARSHDRSQLLIASDHFSEIHLIGPVY